MSRFEIMVKGGVGSIVLGSAILMCRANSAQAETMVNGTLYCWFNSLTGEKVNDYPQGTEDGGDSNHRHRPGGGDIPAKNFHRQPNGTWMNSLTGEAVNGYPQGTEAGGDSNHRHRPGGGDIPAKNFYRAPCNPPPKTATPAPPPEHASIGGGTHTGPYVELAAGAAFVQGTNPAVIGGLGMQNETGFDVAASGGYDFGRFRLEAELAYKRARTTEFRLTPPVVFGGPVTGGSVISGPFFDSPKIDLPRIDSPQIALPPGQAYVADGPGTTVSLMLNGMLDFGPDDGLQGFVGGGAGIARTHHRLSINRLGPGILDQTDTTFAWQAIAGIRAPITDHIDVTFKYRFFNTSESDLIDFSGQGIDYRLRSHSILVGLTYNFNAPPPPPPVPPPEQDHLTDQVM